MNWTIRPLTAEERKYTYRQSSQISGQTGSIGYMLGDFGSGDQFYTRWTDINKYYNTDSFKQEFNELINTLRSEDCGLLTDLRSMARYGRKNPDSGFSENPYEPFGFRVDTDNFSCLIRCNAAKADYNFFCFCYIKQYLNHHLEEARRGIRFLNYQRREAFRIPDGSKITITGRYGDENEYTCRYIDSTHFEADRRVYHIMEFADMIERGRSICTPKEILNPTDRL